MKQAYTVPLSRIIGELSLEPVWMPGDPAEPRVMSTVPDWR